MAEERTRIHTRITPETERKIAAAMPLSNCQTQNEFCGEGAAVLL